MFFHKLFKRTATNHTVQSTPATTTPHTTPHTPPISPVTIAARQKVIDRAVNDTNALAERFETRNPIAIAIKYSIPVYNSDDLEYSTISATDRGAMIVVSNRLLRDTQRQHAIAHALGHFVDRVINDGGMPIGERYGAPRCTHDAGCVRGSETYWDKRELYATAFAHTLIGIKPPQA